MPRISSGAVHATDVVEKRQCTEVSVQIREFRSGLQRLIFVELNHRCCRILNLSTHPQRCARRDRVGGEEVATDARRKKNAATDRNHVSGARAPDWNASTQLAERSADREIQAPWPPIPPPPPHPPPTKTTTTIVAVASAERVRLLQYQLAPLAADPRPPVAAQRPLVPPTAHSPRAPTQVRPRQQVERPPFDPPGQLSEQQRQPHDDWHRARPRRRRWLSGRKQSRWLRGRERVRLSCH